MTNNQLIQQSVMAANALDIQIVEIGELSESYFGMKIVVNEVNSNTIIGAKKDFESYEFAFNAIKKESEAIIERTKC